MVEDPLNGTVYTRENGEVHNFLKSLTQGKDAWKWINKCRGGFQTIYIEHYDGTAEGEIRMNVMKANLKEIYLKIQDVFPLENYFNQLKECYNKLEDLG